MQGSLVKRELLASTDGCLLMWKRMIDRDDEAEVPDNDFSDTDSLESLLHRDAAQT